MRTADDLRAALNEDAASAATPDRATRVRDRVTGGAAGHAPAALRKGVAPGPASRALRPRRALDVPVKGEERESSLRRRTALVAAAAALLVTVTGVSSAVRSLHGGVVTPAADPDGVLPITTYMFTVDRDPAGLTFQPAGTATGVQGGFWFQGSTFVAPAAVNVGTDLKSIGIPQRPAGAADVTIEGHRGWRAPHPATADAHFNPGDPAEATVWQDGDLWIELLTVNMTPSRIAQLARTLHPGHTKPVTFPARLKYLPAQTHLTATNFHAGMAELVFGPHGQDFTLAIDPTGTTVALGSVTRRNAAPDAASHARVAGTTTVPPRQLTIGEFTGIYQPDNPVTTLSNGHLDITVSYGATPAQAMPLHTLTSLIAGLQPVGTLANPSSWITLDKALPTQP
jgi:hypothetical protein